MLIDVKESLETLEYGKIPGSISAHLDKVGKAHVNPSYVKEKYNEVKPSKSGGLVFLCLPI